MTFGNFSGGPVVKNPCFHCRGAWIQSLLGEQNPTCHGAWPKINYKIKFGLSLSGLYLWSPQRWHGSHRSSWSHLSGRGCGVRSPCFGWELAAHCHRNAWWSGCRCCPRRGPQHSHIGTCNQTPGSTWQSWRRRGWEQETGEALKNPSTRPGQVQGQMISRPPEERSYALIWENRGPGGLASSCISFRVCGQVIVCRYVDACQVQGAPQSIPRTSAHTGSLFRGTSPPRLHGWFLPKLRAQLKYSLLKEASLTILKESPCFLHNVYRHFNFSYLSPWLCECVCVHTCMPVCSPRLQIP